MKRYVVGFLYSDRGHVALIRKARPAWQAGKLNGIGGHIEDGETPHQAMLREFQEESGDVAPGEWVQRAELTGDGWVVYFFASHARYKFVLGLNGNGDGGETVECWQWDNLPTDCLPNLRWLVPLCRDEDIAHAVVLERTP